MIFFPPDWGMLRRSKCVQIFLSLNTFFPQSIRNFREIFRIFFFFSSVDKVNYIDSRSTYKTVFGRHAINMYYIAIYINTSTWY